MGELAVPVVENAPGSPWEVGISRDPLPLARMCKEHPKDHLL